jgi:hypothetical protein
MKLTKKNLPAIEADFAKQVAGGKTASSTSS